MQIHSENKIWGESVEDIANPSHSIRILCLEAAVSGDETLNSFCTVQRSGSENVEWPSSSWWFFIDVYEPAYGAFFLYFPLF